MKKRIWFILLIIIEEIFVSYISVSRVGWDFMKDIVLGIFILNIIITITVIFIGKKSNDTLKGDFKKLIMCLIIIILLKSIIIIHESIYTKQLTDDVVNMYSASFLENINNYDELYNALNISDNEKEILINNDNAYYDWIQLENKKTINFVMNFTPLIEWGYIKSSRIIWLSSINNSNSFKIYKANVSKVDISENNPVKQITRQRKVYIQHLIILFGITTFFEIIWLILLMKVK